MKVRVGIQECSQQGVKFTEKEHRTAGNALTSEISGLTAVRSKSIGQPPNSLLSIE